MKPILNWKIAGLVLLLAGCVAPLPPHAGEETTPPGGETPSGPVLLENTQWILVELNGKTVALAAGQRPPSLQLNPADRRVQGFSGCNRFFGGYQRDGDQLHFGGLAGTRMACPPPFMVLEDDFLKMLEQVNRFQISGRALEWYVDGTRLARFQIAAPQ